MNTQANTATEQRSLNWFRDRLGKITGSQVASIFGKGRAKDDIFSKTALSYLTSIAAERMIPDYVVADDELFSIYLDEVNVTSKAMRIGTEREAEARDLYSEITGNQLQECGCIPHPEIIGFASSPDGLVMCNDAIEGTIEVKCPKPTTYLEYLYNVSSAESLKSVNADYYWQCVSHMAVTGAKWCDFIVFCPYISIPLHKVRIIRDDEEIRLLKERLSLALDKVNEIVEKASSSK